MALSLSWTLTSKTPKIKDTCISHNPIQDPFSRFLHLTWRTTLLPLEGKQKWAKQTHLWSPQYKGSEERPSYCLFLRTLSRWSHLRILPRKEKNTVYQGKGHDLEDPQEAIQVTVRKMSNLGFRSEKGNHNCLSDQRSPFFLAPTLLSFVVLQNASEPFGFLWEKESQTRLFLLCLRRCFALSQRDSKSGMAVMLFILTTHYLAIS